MERNIFLATLKNISRNKFGNEDLINLSKSLGFYFLKKYIDSYFDDEDYWNSCVDASNDRGFDYVFIDDTDSHIKVYIMQCKYSYDGETFVNETEVSKTILNFKNFHTISGNINQKLKDKINEFKLIIENDEKTYELIGIYLNLGKFEINALDSLNKSGFDVYDFERFNSEILLDPKLPDIKIFLKKEPLFFDNNSILGVLSLKDFLDSSEIQELITNQKIFHYNVRGLMNIRKNSIANDIIKTAKNEPEKFMQRNNGITIICQYLDIESDLIYILKGASVINGQQTLRALYRSWSEFSDDIKSKIFLTVKVITISNAVSDGLEEILNIAKASNKQNAIKESDLFSNDLIQKDIEESSFNLPEQLKFSYVIKRSVVFPEERNVITRDEATLLLSLFLNQNPSDRLEGLYRSHYNSIYENTKAEYIILIKKLRDLIGEKHKVQDSRSDNNKFWSNMFYKRFKKAICINFCIYLFSILIKDYFGYQDKNDRKNLLYKIFDKMVKSGNFDLDSYFNDHFWEAYQITCLRIIRSFYDDNSYTSDILRKEIDRNRVVSIFNDYIGEKTISQLFNPSINV